MAGILSGLSNTLLGNGSDTDAAGILNNLYNQYANLNVPSVQSEQVTPGVESVQGTLDPQKYNATLLGSADNLSNVNVDPRLRQSQMQSLDTLNKIANGGYSDADRAAIQQSLNQSNQNAEAQNKQMLQSQDMRGVGSSDAALASRLQQQQSSANQANNAALTEASQSRNRAMQAATQSAGLAGDIGNTDYTRGANLANAQNQREYQNNSLQNQQGMYNTQQGNAAQQFNLQNKQNVANTNTGIQNNAAYYNKGLVQQNYNNQLQKLGGESGAGQSQANYLNNYQNANNQFLGQMIQGGAKAMSDERNKTDIQDFNSDSFLDKLKPYEYEYKNPDMDGPGKHAGVMAQDLEKTDLGSQMVQDTPRGKIVDYGQAAPTILASLVELHHRLKKIEGGGKDNG